MSDKLKVALALGLFDGVHIGHVKVIKQCVKKARKHRLFSVVLTFDGDLKGYLNKQPLKCVYTYNERQEKIKSLGVDVVHPLKVDETTLSKTAEEFLIELTEKYQVKYFVCGKDFRFGKNAEGNVKFLKNFAKRKGIKVKVVSPCVRGSKKISTTQVKELLSQGKLDKAKKLLGKNYSITGKVIGGRRVGSKLGFPTANVIVDKEKTPLKKGVYAGYVELNGVYKAIINYGGRPSFELYEPLMEVHIIDFNGDLYEKTITVNFVKFLRETIKFESIEELVEQLEKDVKNAKEIKI